MSTVHDLRSYRGPVRTVVLDWAGTTVDYGSRAPASSFIGAFRELGVAVTMEQVRRPMGRAKRDHIQALLEMPDVAAQWTEVHGAQPDEGAIDKLYETFLPIQRRAVTEHAELIPGTLEALAACADLRIRVGSTTGYTRDLLDRLAPLAAEQGYAPEAAITADDLSPGRPAPFLIFECARRLNVYPMAAVVKVDDTTSGVQAGVNAGCWSVGVVLTGNLIGLSRAEVDALAPDDRAARLRTARRELLQAGAHFAIEGIHELPAVLDRIEGELRRGIGPADPPPSPRPKSSLRAG